VSEGKKNNVEVLSGLRINGDKICIFLHAVMVCIGATVPLFVIQCFRIVAVHFGYGAVRYVDLVFSIEVAVEVSYCCTVFIC
jgi:hypothetical protein